MPTNAQNYYANSAAAMRPVKTAMPDLLKAFGGVHQAAMMPGALTTAEKELVAMAIGIVLRCEGCIYTHVQGALRAGATREQVIEAAGVALLMQGGPGYAYLPRVTEALDALAEQAQGTAQNG